jgi:hypothetical protein
LWGFQRRGVLALESPRHRLLSQPDGTPLPAGYRVMDDVEFAAEVWELRVSDKGVMERVPYR